MPRGQRKTGVPDQNNRADRPRRVTVGMARSQLEVQGLDPDKHYRWVRDISHEGKRIAQFVKNDWEFADGSEGSGLVVGEEYTTTTQDLGTIVRRPSGTEGDYLYLMCTLKEFYDEARQSYDEMVDETEEALFANAREDADTDVYVKAESRRGQAYGRVRSA